MNREFIKYTVKVVHINELLFMFLDDDGTASSSGVSDSEGPKVT